MTLQRTFARSLVTVRTWPFVIDMGVAVCGLAIFFAIVGTGRYWLSKPAPIAEISHSISALPLYAFYSIVRIGIAYLLSLVFAIAYGYIAAYNPRIEPWMVAVLDILQSIPVLSFLPPVVLFMVALIPGHQLGIEMAVILLIFTGQVWNLAFSFYSSLKSIPREMMEASRIYRYSAWQRFWQLEMPYAAIGLVWNSIVSVAGGWFALIACEISPFANYTYQLPGIGSYLQVATNTGDYRALTFGIGTVILIVVATDQLRLAPAHRLERQVQIRTGRVRRSRHARRSSLSCAVPASSVRSPAASGRASKSQSIAASPAPKNAASSTPLDEEKSTPELRLVSSPGGCGSRQSSAGGHCRLSSCSEPISWPDLKLLFEGAAATFGRVNAALLISAAWTVPVGVAIGLNPRLSRIVQPTAQVLASIPATAFFPIILIGLVKIGGGLGIGSIALMLLGTQWYILFNVIAGAMSIPSDLREVTSLYRFTRWQRWTKLILPGIFPYLITGMVTASGGAWNASVYAEYSHLKDSTLQTIGLGAEISSATDSGRFPIILLATIMISLMVVTMNRLVWRRLYRLAETRYKLEG